MAAAQSAAAARSPRHGAQVLHAFAFLLGGTTFVAGTAALFFPGFDTLSALLYTIGSCG